MQKKYKERKIVHFSLRFFFISCFPFFLPSCSALAFSSAFLYCLFLLSR